MDTKNAFLLGSTAAAVMAGVYILYGPSERKSKLKKDTCPGLRNLGNTCFLNAVLQALAPCYYTVQWLGDFVDKRINKGYTQCIAFALIKILKVLNNQGDTEHTNSALEVVENLRLRRWVIPPTEEQDSHELFHVLTETLEEESTKYPSVVSIFDVSSIYDSNIKYQPKGRAATRCQGLLPIIPCRDSEHPFRGLLASQLQCKLCGYKNPVRYDKFDSLSLSIPPNQYVWVPVTLDRLLRHYVMSEYVQNVECQGCAKTLHGNISQCHNSKPLPKATFMKRLTIGKLPQNLCIHIQRTIWLNNGMPMKRNDHVEFPEVLDMSPYVYHKRKAPDLSVGLANGLFGLQGGSLFNNRQKFNSAPKPAVSNMKKNMGNNPLMTPITQQTSCEQQTNQRNSPQSEMAKTELQLNDTCYTEIAASCYTEFSVKQPKETDLNKSKTEVDVSVSRGTLEECDLNQSTDGDESCETDKSVHEKSLQSVVKPSDNLNIVEIVEDEKRNTEARTEMDIAQPKSEIAWSKKENAQSPTLKENSKFLGSQDNIKFHLQRQESSPDSKYRLVAVVVHLGDVFSGHFVTYRRAPSGCGQRHNEKWLYTSDEHVSRASLQSVLQAEAYLLFYERF
ncbi:ubiquitin carboxyl-terminal hydrolase 30 [Lingula anatina]|uniref:Ubiquitin carboxyl-terminal hydrolase n=1 Tax=Lingula anatina TaxID=7574 RepID=A0A1S3IUL4_LINAN|nr:ubiquitin carboxyl-terminal hydrolase 30 [Lingula anatina]|eukprot:XP_013401621.1 ubiquitin carboxyl-terminal hydrolase 30 [Lingula anatina]